MRIVSLLLAAAVSLPALCQPLDPEPRLGSLEEARKPDGFYRDAVTMTYWHMMSIKCPFEKHDVDDLDFIAMVIFMADDAPHVTPDLQARVDREGEALVDRALAGDPKNACRSALAAMRADGGRRLAETEAQEKKQGH